MGRLQIRRRGYALGAQITGVDLTKPIDEATAGEIRTALLEHVVLCFPDQDLDAFKLREFCLHFGELDTYNTGMQKNLHPDVPEVVVRANKPFTINGKPAPTSPTVDQWHSDYSQSPRPSTYTFLNGKELPEVGGDTMFANMYMAYETLSPAFQRMIDPLEAVHDVAFGSTYLMSSPEQRAQMRQRNPPFVHPIVRVHPETGRKALFTGARVSNFVGMAQEEAKPILEFLMRHATRYEFIYRHRWAVDDLLVWDNRCAMHYAVADYDPSQLRRMLRCSLVGPTMGHPYVEDRGNEAVLEPVAT